MWVVIAEPFQAYVVTARYPLGSWAYAVTELRAGFVDDRTRRGPSA